MKLSNPDARRARGVRRRRGPLLVFGMALLLWSPLASAPSWGQQGFGVPNYSSVPASALRVHLVTLENQPAEEAVKLVLPLLSSQGSVEVQPAGNTIVIRDTPTSLARILPVLADFDHPRRAVRVSVWLIRAHRAAFSPAGVVTPNTPELDAVVETLRRHLRYANYELLGRDDGGVREGEIASLELGQGFRVRFQVGTALGDQRLRLNAFEVSRRSGGDEGASLLRSNLNLWLDRPTVVALTRPPAGDAADDSALLVVIQGRLEAADPPRER